MSYLLVKIFVKTFILALVLIHFNAIMGSEDIEISFLKIRIFNSTDFSYF
jgi:hypothetical protein